MAKKLHKHSVTLGQRRRDNKKAEDILKKGVSKEALTRVFNTYYRDQVRALYRTVCNDK